MKVVFREMRGGRSDPSPSGIGRVKRARQFEGEEKELTFVSILSVFVKLDMSFPLT
jgi:hypothetical protein